MDVGCRTDDFFTDWLNNPKLTGVGGNATTVDLKEDGIIEIRNVRNKKARSEFRIPKKQYLKMMSLWKNLCKVKQKEIIITWNGKKIIVVGNNEVITEAIFKKKQKKGFMIDGY